MLMQLLNASVYDCYGVSRKKNTHHEHVFWCIFKHCSVRCQD